MKRAWRAVRYAIRGWRERQHVDPWEHGRDTLHQPHIPQVLQDMLTDADDTLVLDGPVLLARQPGKRRLRRDSGGADRPFRYRGARRVGRAKVGAR